MLADALKEDNQNIVTLQNSAVVALSGAQSAFDGTVEQQTAGVLFAAVLYNAQLPNPATKEEFYVAIDEALVLAKKLTDAA